MTPMMVALLVKNTLIGRNGIKIKIRVKIGEYFGRVEIVGEPFWSHCPGQNHRTQCVVCLCHRCGKYFATPISPLTHRKFTTCGCGKGGWTYEKHGGARKSVAREKLYHAWGSMNARCYRLTHKAYPQYGEKGITVCDEWRNDYIAFRTWAQANGFSPGLTIDRINPKKGYSPDNCQWITKVENGKKVWTDMAKERCTTAKEIANLKKANQILLVAYCDLLDTVRRYL